ncbi:MAG: hypothetical protein ABF289_03390 [Clostridiales bacterium]
MKRKIMVSIFMATFMLSVSISAYAVDNNQTSEEKTRTFKSKKEFKMNAEKLQEMADEKGLTVKELKEEMKTQREAKLQEMADEKGITLEELKEEMKTKREEMKVKREVKLQEMADEKGITLEELKEEMKIKREVKLQKMADEKGITLKELKEKFKDKKSNFKGKNKSRVEK